MTDNPRDRIADALYWRGGQESGMPDLQKPWNDTFPIAREYWRGIADAVIAALGLQRASRPNDYGHVDYPAGDRYITDWIADDRQPA